MSGMPKFPWKSATLQDSIPALPVCGGACRFEFLDARIQARLNCFHALCSYLPKFRSGFKVRDFLLG